MDFERAREIVQADETIEVLLNGFPVWIEELDPGSARAKVKPLNRTGEKVIDVPVAQLVEGRFL
ncbi:MAG: H-type small acid-soluble spore protein [Candidatus Desulforudis sp.]|nr:H-type small acid-soluble spore protein [Desulforudis sp.]